jgi:filamentous hemagglutinin
MNQNLYRIVFNKNTGAQAAGGAATSRRHRNFSSGLTVAMLFGGIHIAYAQIQADPNAAGNQRPVIDNTANGLPLVQIATPNAAGLSHNQYRQSTSTRAALFSTTPAITPTRNSAAGSAAIRTYPTAARASSSMKSPAPTRAHCAAISR